MSIYIYIFLSSVAGILAGMWVGVICSKKDKKNQWNAVNQDQSGISRRRNKASDKSDKDKRTKEETILKKKLKKPELSMMEFANAADGIDHKEYVKEMRGKEDAAYNILKEKKPGEGNAK